MTDFIFNTTPSIHQTIGGSKKLGKIVERMQFAQTRTEVLFVTDPGIIKLDICGPAIESLKKEGFEVTIFDGVQADPKATTILEAVELAKQNNIACVIGFGGGSSMDVAKLIALLATSNQCLDDIYGVNQAKGKRLPLVLVPTTAGTGSEVTAVSIVTTGSKEKKGIVTPLILPDIALLDAELTVGLPAHITAATGVDAMVHAIEAFTSKSPNNNPISKILAKQALSLLGANIRKAVFESSDLQVRSNMLLGSMLAGQAFANSPVAAVHALAYPIGSLFHVPHGLSNALVLCQVMRFNAQECSAEYAELAPYVFPNIDITKSDQTINADFIQKLSSLNQELRLETGLRLVGIKKSDIAQLAGDAMKQTRLLTNNPRKITLIDAVNIYEEAY